MDVLEQLQNSDDIFEDHNVDVAYLFGSSASGRAHAESDVDVGIVFAEQDAGVAHLSQLERRLNEQLDTRTDCRVLNDADPRFVYTVLRTGRPVYVVDDERRRDFEYRSMRTYLDVKPMYDEYDRYVERRVTS